MVKCWSLQIHMSSVIVFHTNDCFQDTVRIQDMLTFDITKIELYQHAAQHGMA